MKKKELDRYGLLPDKRSARIRYNIVIKAMKILTPSFYKKCLELNLLGKMTFHHFLKGLADVPRPAILFIKERFNGRALRGVEIGVQMGINSDSILHELNMEMLYLIDPWEKYDNYDRNYDYDTSMSLVVEKFIFKNNVSIIRDYSEKAYFQIEDNSLDFIYIDGNHDYEHVYQDIMLYYPKIKKGGVISGHDSFNCPDVLEAVRDFCESIGVRYDVKLPDWIFIKRRGLK